MIVNFIRALLTSVCLLICAFVDAQSQECIDSSYTVYVTTDDRWFNFRHAISSLDGNILAIGSTKSKLASATSSSYPYISKLDTFGNVLWSKELNSGIYASSAERVLELIDGSIIIAGTHTSLTNVGGWDRSITKLTASGEPIWTKLFRIDAPCSSSNVLPLGIAEGAHGDLLFSESYSSCGNGHRVISWRLNANGDLVWTKTFVPPAYSFTESPGVFYKDGVVLLTTWVANGYGSDGVNHIDFMKLDYGSGSLLSLKSWQIGPGFSQMDNPARTSVMKLLPNGHLTLLTTLYGAVDPSEYAPRLGVIEFDEDQNFLSGYNIYSSLNLNYPQTEYSTFRSGDLLYSLTVINGIGSRVYHGSIKDQRIVKERVKSYPNDHGNPADQHIPLADGSYLYIRSHRGSGVSDDYIEINRWHDSDTASNCTGFMETFSTIVPTRFIDYNFRFTEIKDDKLIISTPGIATTQNLFFTSNPVCEQKAFCDRLTISGPNTICGIDDEVIFKAHKNNECGTIINWNYEKDAVSSIRNINDTTIAVRFSKGWQGWISAEVLATCGVLRDSLYITVTNEADNLLLGGDTLICESDSMLLTTGTGYVSYLWSDGSTSSSITINKAGSYFLDVWDACGNKLSDTIQVQSVSSVPFQLGPDIMVCANATVELVAPFGMISYAWGPNYNIQSATGNKAQVKPQKDTAYHVKAEYSRGCFVMDTLAVRILPHTTIQLGDDVSLCAGDSVSFSVSGKFVSYHWNTGAVTSSITTNKTGKYSVTATDVNGCKVFDSVRVVEIRETPDVKLGDDFAICEGASRILSPGTYSSYLWHDGSTNNEYVASLPGTYSVTVTDAYGCVSGDTVELTKIYETPKNFLPADTAMCGYGRMSIVVQGAYNQYNWNTGNRNSFIVIDKPGTYWLTATDYNNCTGTDSIQVTFKKCAEGFFVPNAFTPQGDGRNDEFKPYIGADVTEYVFELFNRWGEKVFSSNDPQKGWNGRVNGKPQDTDTYLWHCRFKSGGIVHEEKGSVILIR